MPPGVDASLCLHQVCCESGPPQIVQWKRASVLPCMWCFLHCLKVHKAINTTGMLQRMHAARVVNKASVVSSFGAHSSSTGVFPCQYSDKRCHSCVQRRQRAVDGIRAFSNLSLCHDQRWREPAKHDGASGAVVPVVLLPSLSCRRIAVLAQGNCESTGTGLALQSMPRLPQGVSTRQSTQHTE